MFTKLKPRNKYWDNNPNRSVFSPAKSGLEEVNWSLCLFGYFGNDVTMTLWRELTK